MITTINEFKQHLNESFEKMYIAQNDFTITPKRDGSPVKINTEPFVVHKLDSLQVSTQRGSLGTLYSMVNFSTNKRASVWDSQWKNEVSPNIERAVDESITESIGDITAEEIAVEKFKETFTNELNTRYKKESIYGADWAGIHAWNVSGNTWDGYFIVQDENAGPWEVSYDLIHRWDDENDYVQSETITSLNTHHNDEVKVFLAKADEYLNGPVQERNDFDQVARIGKISKDIKIDVLLKHSYHSMERQGRASEYVKNSEIKATVEKATEQMIDLLINNTLNIGDPVWIYNSENDLNVVGSLNANKHNSDITFKLITVMYHKEFRNKHNTFKVTI